jgi:clan AA aspartic protease (TIGR02281 family)
MRPSLVAITGLATAAAFLALAPHVRVQWAIDPQVAAAAPLPQDDAAEANPAPGENSVPLRADHGALSVRGVIDQAIKVRFIVDSGATDVSISADVARELIRTGQLTHSDYVGRGMTILADGSHVPSQLLTLRSIRVGDREIRNVTATIAGQGGEMLLGQSFLRRFKSWSIDNRRRVLVLQD